MVVKVSAASKRHAIANPALLFAGIAVIGVHILQEVFIGQSALGASVANFLQISCAAVAVAACIAAHRRAGGYARPFWLLVGLSFLVWIAADLGWAYCESRLQVLPARDSILHFLIDCRALLVAMALLLDPEEPDSVYPAHAGWTLDVCQLFIIFTLIYLGWYQAATNLQSKQLSLVRSDQIELGENVAVLALGTIQVMRARNAQIRRFYQALLICLAPMFVGICLTDYQEMRRGIEVGSGTWMDIWWSATFLLTAAWAMGWQPVQQAASANSRNRRFWSMFLENAFYAAGPLIVLIQVTQLGSDWRRASFLLLGSSILCFAARLALSELGEVKAAGQLRDANDSLSLNAARLREFERVVEGLDEMIAVVDSDYRYQLVNRAFLKYRGMKSEDLIGQDIRQILKPQVFDSQIKQKLDDCFQGKVVRYEMQYTYPHRGERDLSVSYFPISGPNGVERAACILEDITDRKRAETALRESEDRYRDLVEHSEDLVCTHDLKGNLLTVNPAPARVLGYEVSELMRIPMRNLVAPEFREQFDEYLETIRTKGTARGFICVLAKNGQRRIWEYSNTLRTEGVASPVVRGLGHDVTERKRAETRLQKSEQRYRILFEKAVAGVGIISMEGCVIDCNDAWARIFGFDSAAECKGTQAQDLYATPSERELFLAELKQCGFFSNREWRFRRRDGSTIWVLLNSVLVNDGASESVIQSTIFDITERNRAEAGLRASDARMRLFIEHSPAAVAVFDRDMRYIQASRRWMDDYGLRNRDLNGVSHYEVFPEISDSWKQAHQRGLAGEMLAEDGDRFDRADGSVQWLRWEIHPWREESGQVGGIAIFSEDITARKRAEDALQRSEERFRVALKDSPITVFNQDRDLRYTWIYNPRPYWHQEVVGKTDDELLGVKKASALTELKKKVLSAGIAVREEVAVPQNGHRHVFDMSIEPLFNAQSEVIGITGAAIDIARLREMADQLQESTEQLAREKSYLQTEIQSELGFEEIIGKSPSLREVLRKTRVVAPTDSTVLLLGETGTGKELVARSLHELSTRRDHTFVKLNCAAVPSGLLESELFGHEKGAFTGAVSQKVGRIELAHKGTLFLDEIGEMTLELQPKLLRVLQDREFERLGGVKTIFADVRIIAATNRDLRQDVADRNFREDLFYRLNVFPIELPALRNRKEDIPLLVHHFVEKHNAKMGKHVTEVPSDVMRSLCRWSWPGNIRELENMIERMVIMSKGSVLIAPPAEIQQEADQAEDDLAEMERDHILRILRITHGVLSGPDGAANRLGLKRTTLQSMIKRLGIEPREYRGWSDGTSGSHL